MDLAVKDPSGTWTNLSNNLDNLRGLSFASPAQGSWEVHVLGTNIPTGPQHFALALNIDTDLVNLTEDMDFDGIEDDFDDCILVPGTSTIDRSGCLIPTVMGTPIKRNMDCSQWCRRLHQ